MFLAFRFFAGCAGVAPLTIGAGSIGDLMAPAQRGTAMAIFSMGPLLGPIIGPIAGGYISEGWGWRWVFRILGIAVSSLS
jgi:MFS family permease